MGTSGPCCWRHIGLIGHLAAGSGAKTSWRPARRGEAPDWRVSTLARDVPVAGPISPHSPRAKDRTPPCPETPRIKPDHVPDTRSSAEMSAYPIGRRLDHVRGRRPQLHAAYGEAPSDRTHRRIAVSKSAFPTTRPRIRASTGRCERQQTSPRRRSLPRQRRRSGACPASPRRLNLPRPFRRGRRHRRGRQQSCGWVTPPST